MWATNLKVVAVAVFVIVFYTTIAHIIPQLESEVPEAVDLSGGATPEALVAAGEKLFNGAGQCTSCHGLGERAPNLLTDHSGEGTIGVRCATREPGTDCKAYLYESLTEPAKYVVKGFEVLMPDLRRLFSSEQIWAIVAYMESQGGQVTVTAADIERTGGAASKLAAAPAGAAPAAGAASGAAPAAAAAGSPAPAPAPPAAPAAPLDARQRALVAAGEGVFNGTAGVCTTCHGTGLLAPNLLTDHAGEGPIGARCGSREPGKECKAYLYESLTDPKAYVVKGFDAIMPANLRTKVSEEQVWALVAFLESQGGRVTVSAADMAGAAAKGPAPAPAGPAPAPAAAAGPAGAPAAASAAPDFGMAAATSPAAMLDLRQLSQERLVGAGEAVFNGRGGCTACHGPGTLAPNLLTDHAGEGLIGKRCGTREPGVDCKAYLYESLTKPEAYLVTGFTNIMVNLSGRFTTDQLWALVAFLESRGGQVTVTAADIERARAESGPAPAAGGPPPATAPASGPAPAGPPPSTTLDPRQLLKDHQCVMCHAIDREGPDTAPSFDGVGLRLTADRIRRKILNPAQDIAAGFENRAGMMPTTFGQRLTAAQLEALVQFLAARQ